MESALKHDDFIVLALTGDVYSSGKKEKKKTKKTICARGKHTEAPGFIENDP